MARSFACAVVRGDPPEVYAAEDEATLNWVLALRVVATADPATLPASVRDELQAALAEERWGDAVFMWMQHADVAVDVYPSMDLFTAADVELGPLELQFRPLFQ